MRATAPPPQTALFSSSSSVLSLGGGGGVEARAKQERERERERGNGEAVVFFLLFSAAATSAENGAAPEYPNIRISEYTRIS